MQRIEGLNKEAREALAFSPLQYMFDFVEENPWAARSYVDGGRCALMLGHYLFLGGAVDEAFARAVAQAELTDARRAELGGMIVFYESESAACALRRLFGRVFDNARRVYKATGRSEAAGERVTRVTRSLLDSGAENLRLITDEVLGTGTYRSMEDFCEKGIGYTFLEDGRVRAFCTSEYPSASALAIGIEVEEECQRRGIASEMTRAFLKTARERNIDVYWECWRDNEPSVRTALGCGFDLLAEYPVLFVPFGD